MQNSHTYTTNLFEQRTFSEKFDMLIRWFNQHSRTILRFLALIFLPISCLQAICVMSTGMNANFASMLSGQSITAAPELNFAAMGILYLVNFIGVFLITAVSLGLANTSFIKRQSISDCTYHQLWKTTRQGISRLFLAIIICLLFFGFVSLIAGLLLFASAYTLIITIPLMIYLFFAICPFFPIYVMTDEPIIEAFTHALRLGTKSWWGFFSTQILTSVIGSIIACIFAIPYYATFAAIGFLQPESGSIAYFLLNGASLLFSTLSTFVSYIIYVFMIIIVVIQYGHAARRHDGTETADHLSTPSF